MKVITVFQTKPGYVFSISLLTHHLAKQNHSFPGGRVLWIITFIFSLIFHMNPLQAQNAKIDSLLQLEQQLPDDTAKALILNQLTYEFYRSDISKYQDYLERALTLNKKLNFKKGLARAINLSAIGHIIKSEFEKAIELNLESLGIAEEIGFRAGIFSASKDLGIIYETLGDYEQALYYAQKSLEHKDGTAVVANTYRSLAKLHLALGNENEAEKYVKLGIQVAQESNDPKTLTGLYFDQGDHAREKGELPEALNFYDQALTIALNQNDSIYMPFIYTGMANVYRDQGAYSEALNKFKTAKKLFKKSFALNRISTTISIADVYNKLLMYSKAIETLEEVNAVVHQLKAPLPEVYGILAEAHAGLKEYEKAFSIRSAQLHVQDSLDRAQNKETIAKLEKRYQLKEKQAENEQLKQQSEAQQQEILLTQNIVRQQRIITFGTIIGLIVTTGLLIYVFRLIQKLRHTNVQLKKQSSDLRIARDKAESAAKAKSEFLSVMSHEIRTPMNAVIGMTHLLMDEEPRNDQMEYLDTLQFSGTNLIALINDILDFSKIEAGKLTLEQADLDLESLVKSITASTAIKGNDKGIEVKYSFDPELADMYIGDSVRLGQVLTNLMGNAVKFTEEGYVELQVAPVDENKLRFSVKDTGIGIPKDKQKQIFEAFSQAADDTTRKFGGTGLGLSISRRLVELMGGELQIESEPGEGSVFFFEIELPKSDTPKKTQSEKAESGKLSFGSLAGTRVLVAEDNKINQMVVRKFLEKWDLDITIANNGQEAVDAWEKEHFDLILMDVNMPVLNGTGATGVIRERELESQKHIPILAFTASVVEDEIKAIYDAGMDDWVSKPFEPSVLYQKIRKYSQEVIL